jgi:hypothetical protein
VRVDAGATEGDEASDALDSHLSIDLMQPDGSGSVDVMQMHFRNTGLQAALKTIGMDETTISFTHFDPPLGNEYVTVMSRLTSGDASTKAAAKARLATLCRQQ